MHAVTVKGMSKGNMKKYATNVGKMGLVMGVAAMLCGCPSGPYQGISSRSHRSSHNSYRDTRSRMMDREMDLRERAYKDARRRQQNLDAERRAREARERRAKIYKDLQRIRDNPKKR